VDAPGKYQASFILESDSDAAAEIKAVAKVLKKDHWPSGPGKMKGYCFTQYPDEQPDDEDEQVNEEYLAKFVVSASESSPPQVINLAGAPVAENAPGAPYAGCICIGWISLWTQDNEHGKRVNANLVAVQFSDDGDKFSTRPDHKIDFDNLGSQGDEKEDEQPF